MAKLSSDQMPPAPELPDNISLPLQNVSDLDEIEEVIRMNSAAKDALVSVHSAVDILDYYKNVWQSFELCKANFKSFAS